MSILDAPFSASTLTRVLGTRDSTMRSALIALLAPAAYLTVEPVGGAASQAVSVDNGMYDVLVEGATKQIKRIFVANGAYTITPANSDATFTRARFFGPYGLTPNVSSPAGAVMAAGIVFNSLGNVSSGVTKAVYGYNADTAADFGPNLYPCHSGWCSNTNWNYTFHTNRIDKRARDANWTPVVTNSAPFAGLPTTPNAPDHVGDGCYYNGKIYAAVEKYLGVSSTNQMIVAYDAETLVLSRYFDVSAVMGGNDVGGIDINNDIMYVCCYTDGRSVRRFDINGNHLADLVLEFGSKYREHQGIVYRNGKVYISCRRNNQVETNITVVCWDATTGALLNETIIEKFTPVTGSVNEGLAFGDDGRIGVLIDDGVSISRVNYYTLAENATGFATKGGKGGFAAKGAYCRLMGVQFGSVAYDVMTRFNPDSWYDFNQLWDLTDNGGAFEGWITSTGAVIARSNTTSASASAGQATIGSDHTIAYGATAATSARQLYVDNANRGGTTTETYPAFPANADVSVGASNLLNTPTQGTFRYFYTFTRQLTLAEHQAVEADPGSVWSPTNALAQSIKDLMLG